MARFPPKEDPRRKTPDDATVVSRLVSTRTERRLQTKHAKRAAKLRAKAQAQAIVAPRYYAGLTGSIPLGVSRDRSRNRRKKRKARKSS